MNAGSSLRYYIVIWRAAGRRQCSACHATRRHKTVPSCAPRRAGRKRVVPPGYQQVSGPRSANRCRMPPGERSRPCSHRQVLLLAARWLRPEPRKLEPCSRATSSARFIMPERSGGRRWAHTPGWSKNSTDGTRVAYVPFQGSGDTLPRSRARTRSSSARSSRTCWLSCSSKPCVSA